MFFINSNRKNQVEVVIFYLRGDTNIWRFVFKRIGNSDNNKKIT